VLHINKQFVKN